MISVLAALSLSDTMHGILGGVLIPLYFLQYAPVYQSQCRCTMVRSLVSSERSVYRVCVDITDDDVGVSVCSPCSSVTSSVSIAAAAAAYEQTHRHTHTHIAALSISRFEPTRKKHHSCNNEWCLPHLSLAVPHLGYLLTIVNSSEGLMQVAAWRRGPNFTKFWKCR